MVVADRPSCYGAVGDLRHGGPAGDGFSARQLPPFPSLQRLVGSACSPRYRIKDGKMLTMRYLHGWPGLPDW
jgi:hypothetical protein